jgi:hypothetical protein
MEITICFDESLSRRIKIRKIVPVMEINDPIVDDIIFHDENVSEYVSGRLFFH